jgi:transposase
VQKNIKTPVTKKKYRWKRCRKICPKKPDDELKREKTAQLQNVIELWEKQLVNIYFADEAGFSLTPSIPYSWSKIGEQTGIPTRKNLAYNVFGLKSPEQKLATYLTEKSFDSQFIIQSLDDFAEKITKLTVVILDNAPWHKSKYVQAKIDQWELKGLFLLFCLLIRHTSIKRFAAAIETLWRFIKYQWIKIKDYANLRALKDAIRNILRKFGTEYRIEFTMNY